MVKITYCGEWNYQPRAAGLATELLQKLGLNSQLERSRGGIFEVEYGGELVFSKKKLHRFPDEGEIVDLIKKAFA